MLLLDAGNTFGGSGAEGRHSAALTVEAMGLMGYDALNLGEGEFLFGRPFLEEQRARASFPFLSANLVEPDSGERPYTPYVIVEAGRLRVGIVGLASPELYRGHALTAQDPHSALQAVLPEVEEAADLVIVLARMSDAEAVGLLNSVEGVNVLAIGGVGELTTPPVAVNGALLVQCPRWGMAVGELQVTGNTEGQIVDYRWSSGVLDERIADDPQVVKLMLR